MGEVLDLVAYRRKRVTLTVCMNCGAEYEWHERHDHRCEPDREESRMKHPSNS